MASKVGESYLEVSDLLDEFEQQGLIKESVNWRAQQALVNLLVAGTPAPRIFAHGPDSVVFNWSGDSRDEYLTIEIGRLHLLVSSPDSIQIRDTEPILDSFHVAMDALLSRLNGTLGGSATGLFADGEIRGQ